MAESRTSFLCWCGGLRQPAILARDGNVSEVTVLCLAQSRLPVCLDLAVRRIVEIKTLINVVHPSTQIREGGFPTVPSPDVLVQIWLRIMTRLNNARQVRSRLRALAN